MNDSTVTPKLISVAHLAILLDLKEKTIREWVRLRKIPYVKVNGKLVRFELEKIHAWYKAGKVEQVHEEIIKDQRWAA